ncbi:MAG: 50S ribosomal protein L13 [Candidatus Melainabacteria bacterium]|nr:50S ribosomal protein L13 [Candidatus Melainabacteria bacterium]
MKTFLAQKDKVDRKWWLIDAEGQALGRLATTVASILRGKTKPEFTPNIDTGDFVIIINAEKIKTSGKKNLQKVYYKHSGIPGGFKSESLLQLKQRRPERVIKLAVRGMLPHNRLGDKLITKLNIYKGTSHKHHAQKPQKWEKVKI